MLNFCEMRRIDFSSQVLALLIKKCCPVRKFAANEHATATSIMMFSNIFGAAIGFLQPTHLVPSTSDMTATGDGFFYLYVSQLSFCFIDLLLIYAFFVEQPTFPPTYAAWYTSKSYYNGDNRICDGDSSNPHDGDSSGDSNMSLKTSLKILLTNKHTLMLCNGYGLYFALYCFLGACLNQLVKLEVSDSNVGWMGFSYNCVGIVGTMVSGLLIDRFKCYKSVGCVLTLGSLVMWIVFCYLLLYVKREVLLFIAYVCMAVFAVPYFSVGVEQLAEATYPVPEGTSAAVALTVGNTYSFLAILLLGRAVDGGYRDVVCYIVAGLYALSFLFICCVKTEMRRQEEEEKHHNNSSVQT